MRVWHHDVLWLMQMPSSLTSPSARFPDERMSASGHDPVVILVMQRHLTAAAVNMRPSVAPAERFKYQQMYV